MLGDAYTDDVLSAVPRIDARPPTLEKARGFWSHVGGMVAAPFTGVATGAAQVSATLYELTEPFARTMGAIESGRSVSEELERPSFEIGREAEKIRLGVHEALSPDPETATAAEHLLYEVGRVGVKLGIGAAAGPVGIGALSVEEGYTEARNLMREGVDIETALKAGGVRAGTTALAVLPLVGPTIKATVGLTAVGGPGAFVAEQALTRKILEDAGYDRLAATYDPADPFGLAVSSLLPLPFAFLGARAARARTLGADLAREIEAQVSFVSRETADAAHVAADVRARERVSLRTDLEGSAAYARALDVAEKQMARGDPVDVAELIADLPSARVVELQASVRALDDEIAAAQSKAAEILPELSERAEPGQIRGAKDELARMEQTRVDTSPEAVKAIAKQVQADERVSYKAALSKATKQVSERAAEWEAKATRLRAFVERNKAASTQEQRLGEIEKRIADLQRKRDKEQIKLDKEVAQSPVDREQVTRLIDFARALREIAPEPVPEVPLPTPIRGKARDLAAENIALRKESAVMRKLMECMNG
jgi:hypothetical protein